MSDPARYETPCVHGGRARCWPCMTDSCYESPTLHAWADAEDIEHAAAMGQVAPTGWCGCAFCGEPAVQREGHGPAKADDRGGSE